VKVQDAMDAVEKLQYLAMHGERDHGPAVRACVLDVRLYSDAESRAIIAALDTLIAHLMEAE